MAKYKSAKGQIVDVDLIKMKQQLVNEKKTDSTIKREHFVTDGRRRSSSKRVSEMLANKKVIDQKLKDQKAKRNTTTDDVLEEINLDNVESQETDNSPKKRIIKNKAESNGE